MSPRPSPGTYVILLVQTSTCVINAAIGELLRDLIIDPAATTNYVLQQ